MRTACYQCWNFRTLHYSPQLEKYQDFQSISFHIKEANSVQIYLKDFLHLHRALNKVT